MTLYRDGFEGQRIIDRPALRVELDRSLDNSLTLIVAQAGAGKTTLLRQWMASHPELAFVPLDVDPSDDDPAHFARRLIAALAGLHPAVSKVVAPNGDGLSAPLMTALAEALEPLPDVVIVIDNFHQFSNVRLVSDIGRLIQRTPPNVHWVLSTRVDPPISLSHHRLHEDINELRRADLAFSLSEATELLERLVRRTIPYEHVHVLWARTEGWAAGLQLAGLNLRQHDDAEAFLADFGGSDRLVADYLGEEVLASLSAERRRLLLQLSALDDMCRDLIHATTGLDDAQSFLDALEKESMFLVPLDERGEWFRFHHLFRELLRSRLRAESPAEELKIVTSAADWSLSKGRVKSAMGYLLRAQARDGALEAMLAVAGDFEQHTQPSPLEPTEAETADITPPANDRADVVAAVRQVLNDDSGDRLAPASRAAFPEPSVWGSPSRRSLGYVAAQVLWRARPEASPEAARRRLIQVEARYSRKPVNELTRADVSDLTGALVAGGRAYFLAGDITEARKWLTRARVAAAGSDVVEHIAASSALSLVEAWSGNAQLANMLVTETLTTARNAGMLALPSIADASLASVLTAVDDEPAPATAPSSDGVSKAELDPRPEESIPPASVPSGGVVTVAPSVLFERAIESLKADDSYSVRKIVENWHQLIPSPDPLSQVQYHILRAGLADYDDAAEELRRQLTEAVRVAEIHGLVDVFIHAGPMILGRLPSIAGPQAAFSNIIAARARLFVEPTDGWTLPEPLTDREREILSYLPTRFSNVELAQRFFVSVNTIKTHIAHIYRKLDVADRDAAISRARELGIL